jgi:hypothetical protein
MRTPLALLIIFSIGSASAQLVSVGVKGGISITDPGYYSSDESHRYVVGPSVEVRLPFRYAVEADALYMRVGRTTIFNYPGILPGTDTTQNTISTRTRGNSWEFPILGKYYFNSPGHKVRPFLGTGYSFRTTWFHDDSTVTVLSPSPITSVTTPYKSDYRSSLQVGAAFTAGLRIGVGRMSVLPELRYTRWGSTDGTSRKNEAKFLLGISF